MRKFIWYSLIFFAGCKVSEDDRLKAFIPGTYVATIHQEFSRGNDTLIISLISNSGNNYQVIRHTTFQRMLDGKNFPVERETEKWITVYSKELKVLSESGYSSVISFFPEKKILFVGSKQYQKI